MSSLCFPFCSPLLPVNRCLPIWLTAQLSYLVWCSGFGYEHYQPVNATVKLFQETRLIQILNTAISLSVHILCFPEQILPHKGGTFQSLNPSAPLFKFQYLNLVFLVLFFSFYSAPGKEVLRLSSLPFSTFLYISVASQFVALRYTAAVGKVQQRCPAGSEQIYT